MKTVDVNFDKSIFNKSFYDFYKCDSRYLIETGGAGSGKSVKAAQKILLRMLQTPNHRFLFCRKVFRTIRHSQYQLFKDLVSKYNLQGLFHFKESTLDITCLHNNSQILSIGLDDVEKAKSIAGITGMWIEEGTEISEYDFTQLDLRLRGDTPDYKQIIMTLNPIDEFHWINKRFYKNIDEKATVKRSTFLDNRFLDNQYIETLQTLKNQDDTLWRIYGLGEWATAKGLIYNNWSTINAMPEKYDDCAYGLDFGYNNPSALINIGLFENEIYLDEIIYQSHLTNSELIEKLKLIPELYVEHKPIYADTEDPNRITEIRRAGFNIHNADKSVKGGLDYCKRFKLNVYSKSVNLIKEITTYKYKEDYKNDVVLDEPVKFNDHMMDSFRYALYSHGRIYNWLKSSKVPTMFKTHASIYKKSNHYTNY